MTSLFIVLLTICLLGICGFVILLILMQRPSEESGMGATLGGGAVTSVFGGEAVNTLAKTTRYCVIIFFSLSLILSLIYMSLEKTLKSQNLLEAKSVAVPAKEEIIPAEEAISSEEAIENNQNAAEIIPAEEAISAEEESKSVAEIVPSEEESKSAAEIVPERDESEPEHLDISMEESESLPDSLSDADERFEFPDVADNQ